MAENIQISKKQVAFVLVGVMLAAFLGIIAGQYVIQWKLGVKGLRKPGANLLLKVGQVFPEWDFVSLGGQPSDGSAGRTTNFSEILKGKKSVILFLTTECSFCSELVNRWAATYPEISSEYQVIGVSYERIDRLKEYQQSQKVPFPLFNDSLGKFTSRYKIDAYPTIIGLNAKREIVFVEFGNRPRKIEEI